MKKSLSFLTLYLTIYTRTYKFRKLTAHTAGWEFYCGFFASGRNSLYSNNLFSENIKIFSLYLWVDLQNVFVLCLPLIVALPLVIQRLDFDLSACIAAISCRGLISGIFGEKRTCEIFQIDISKPEFAYRQRDRHLDMAK